MRAILSIVSAVAFAACAGAQHPADPSAPLSASYDLDAHTMMPIVYDATHAQHYRVAVVEPRDGDARFVMVPRGGGAPLIVHVAAQSHSVYRFADCIGACATRIAVSS